MCNRDIFPHESIQPQTLSRDNGDGQGEDEEAVGLRSSPSPAVTFTLSHWVLDKNGMFIKDPRLSVLVNMVTHVTSLIDWDTFHGFFAVGPGKELRERQVGVTAV